MTHKASGCEEQTPVGMDGAEPKNFLQNFPFLLDKLKIFCYNIYRNLKVR